MPIVWRVENKEGDGPYSANWPYLRELRKDHSDWQTWPLPVSDFPDHNYGDRYGFPSERHAKDWFTYWLPVMLNHGFELKEIEVSGYVLSKSGKQVIFKRNANEPNSCNTSSFHGRLWRKRTRANCK